MSKDAKRQIISNLKLNQKQADKVNKKSVISLIVLLQFVIFN